VFTNFVIDKNSVKTDSVIFSDHEAITLRLPFALQKTNSKFYVCLLIIVNYTGFR